MLKKFCKFMLKFLGWTYGEGPMEEDVAIVLGVPHTSLWDFVISFLYYNQFDRSCHVMIKKEFFKWPLGPILRWCGCIPVDRSNSTAMLKSLIEEMKKEKVFHLAIAPEGTRKPVKKWKTGFHLIAKEVNCPVYMGYFDWGKKRVGRGEKVELTDDSKADMARIQALYEEKHYVAKHPKGYITH